MRMRAAWMLAMVFIAGCENPFGPRDGAWDYAEQRDEISGRLNATASQRDLSSGMTIYVRCRGGAFDVYVGTGFATESGAVRFSIDGGGERVGSWTEATDFQALFYPGNARAFAEEIADGEEMIFEAREFSGGPKQARFHLDGLGADLPKVEAACA